MELRASTGAIYLRHAFSQMLAVAERVGESGINVQPAGRSTNAIAALVVHCCGVTEYWLGHVALGRPSTRDRDAEFTTTASLDELRDLVTRTVAQAEDDLGRLDAGRGTPETTRRAESFEGHDPSDAAVVLHVLEELYQHLGHIELTADVLAHR
jgi:hypothetical protein